MADISSDQLLEAACILGSITSNQLTKEAWAALLTLVIHLRRKAFSFIQVMYDGCSVQIFYREDQYQAWKQTNSIPHTVKYYKGLDIGSTLHADAVMHVVGHTIRENRAAVTSETATLDSVITALLPVWTFFSVHHTVKNCRGLGLECKLDAYSVTHVMGHTIHEHRDAVTGETATLDSVITARIPVKLPPWT